MTCMYVQYVCMYVCMNVCMYVFMYIILCIYFIKLHLTYNLVCVYMYVCR